VVQLLALGLFIAWMYQVYRNLPALGAVELSGSPRGAVGWWFAPVINVYRPFQYVREIWRATTPGLTPNNHAGRAVVSGGNLVIVWWALRIITVVLGLSTSVIRGNLATLDEVIRWRADFAFLHLTEILYCLSAIAIMLAVEMRESRRYAALTSGVAPPPL
jgi:hypothetical protein